MSKNKQIQKYITKNKGIQKNISVENISVSVPNKLLIVDSNLKLIYGNKYGFVGHNGAGKSTLLKHIAERIIPIHKSIDMFYVTQELDFDPNKTIFEIVSEAHRKKNKLINRLNELTQIFENESSQGSSDNSLSSDNQNDSSDPNDLMKEFEIINQKLKGIDYAKDESVIRKILFGLGFEHNQQNMKYSLFSGGWKMRVSIARGLYMKPTLLLLDEPTNHLDLNSVIWLTDYLNNIWKKTLVIVSHDIYFLNEICTHIIHLENKRLNYYKGNYDAFLTGYEQHNKELIKEWNKIQKTIKEMQRKSIPKSEVTKFLQKHSHLQPIKPYRVNIKFPTTKEIKWPALTLKNISFGYDNCKTGGLNNKLLFDDISLSFYENDKFTIVGKNGIGKTTLLEIIVGLLKPISGEIIKDNKLRIGYYNQHLTDILPKNKTPIEFLLENKNLSVNDTRKLLGSIGLPNETHSHQLNTLSGGQRARVVLANICGSNPHILLLDEPTNHLDIESIDSFIQAINEFDGAVIMITHNIDVIQKTKSKILELNNYNLKNIEFDDYYNNVLVECNK